MADNGGPMIIRRYITCPDCGNSAPDAGDGLCQDCRDHARLRAAVGEWARARLYGNPGGATAYLDAINALAALAHELGLVEGGAA